MSISSTGLEKKRERPRLTASTPAPAPKPVAALLVPRAVACKMLSISVATAIRLEAAGRLTAIKLYPKQNSKTHYRVEQVRALANPATEEEEADD